MSSEIPLAPLDRLLRNAGAGRVSLSAAKALREVIEVVCGEIASRAIELCEHAKRTTVTDEDIRLAFKQWLKSH
ncbi:MAG: histone family protein [Promethearchaeota archaeon]